MLTSLYNRLMLLAASPRAPLWLIVIAAAEAFIFPIPVDVMLIPMLLANRERALQLAGLCTLASVAGGVLGWVLGAFLMQHIGEPIAHFYHAEQKVSALEALFRQYGIWIILAKGLTPLPYKFVTIAAGAAHYSLLPFIAASIVTRGARFYLEAILLKIYGEPIRHFIEKRLTVILLAALCLILAGVALIALL
ncbi:alkaline phosphatase [Neokomagataea thailandica NBRC 106555]|uniref:DedA family protein n=2 Tax=Neokomagataea TaxID=1223423 RepID=A0A4Y6V9C7_9PROT|nr:MULTISPECIES: YqaA family protein [Neokomagataea]QDH25106.1 DedA family protein [Neokomagataea tanensis]GBR52135.1 alkaline phosphatase [Neokomagataea thailandica NBRC 106555]